MKGNERATSDCTGDHCYGKKALSSKCLTAVKEAVASVQPPQPGQKKEDWWKTYKDAQAVIASHVGKGHAPIYYSYITRHTHCVEDMPCMQMSYI